MSKAIWSPTGWGIGINLVAEKGGGIIEPLARMQRARAVLRPAWFQTWCVVEGSEFEGFAPAAERGWTGDTVPSADELQVVRGRTVLLLNEPEAVWKPEAAAEQTARSLWRLRRMGVPFHWAAPGSNVNGVNMDWLEAYAAELWQLGGEMPTLWAIHLYAPRVDWAETHLARFWRWHGSHGGSRRVLITECGAGKGRDVETQGRMMPWFAGLLGDQRVQGAAWFAAFDYVDQQTYWGVMDQEPLLAAWRAVQQRL